MKTNQTVFARAAIVAALVVASTTVQATTVANWTFTNDVVSGTSGWIETVNDNSGNARDLIRNGGVGFAAIVSDHPTWSDTTAPVSAQWWNGGIADYLPSAGNAAAFETSQFTWELSVKIPDLSASGAFGLLSSVDDGAVQGSNFRVLSNGGIDVYFPGSTYASTAAGLIQNDTWYHLALTYDGTNFQVWRDGTSVLGPTAATLTLNNSYGIVLGQRNVGAGISPSALFNNVRVSDVVLAPNEFNNVVPTPEPTALALLGVGGLLLRMRRR